MMNKVEMSTILDARINMYKFLTGIFLDAPTKELLSHISNSDFLKDLSETFSESTIAHFRKFAETYSDNNYEEIKQEYMNLFRVPLAQYVTPYESVFRDKREKDGKVVEGLLMGPSTIATEHFYKEAGVEVDLGKFKDLPDHIGVEFEFMHFLCEEEKKARENDDKELALGYLKVGRMFLERHLDKWVSDLCDKISKKTKSEFYKGIAAITEEFTSSDLRSLNDFLQETTHTDPAKVS